MTSSASTAIADLMALLQQQADLELTATEMAEILWLGLHLEAGTPSAPQPATQKQPESSVTVVEQTSDQTLQQTESSEPPPVPVVANPPQPKEGTGSGVAYPVAIPAAAALRQRLELDRALRPLMRKVPSQLIQVVDETATAIQFAETRNWTPVVQPAAERWLELAVVVEETSILAVWQDTITEVQMLLERHGAFRTVRLWRLTEQAGQLKLFSGTQTGNRSRPHRPRELDDSGGRRLILLVSDCTSNGWRSGAVPDLLKTWARQNPVTVLQLLPERYWDRTVIGAGYSVGLRATRAGGLSDCFQVEGLSRRRRQSLHRRPQKVFTLPVVTLEPDRVQRWAELIAAAGDQLTPGVVFDLELLKAHQQSRTQQPDLTALQRVRLFRGTASPLARRLAAMMASVPVNWSVIRLIQKNLLPESGSLHLAEIFLSGLLESVPAVEGAQSVSRYEFVAGVRELLRSELPMSMTEEVMEEVADDFFNHLPEAIREQVSRDIERRWGSSLRSFEAWLIPDLPWGEAAAAELLPFAEITREALAQMGEEQAELVEALEQVPRPGPLPIHHIPFPPLQEFEFETALLEIEEELLEAFEFEMATLLVRPVGNRQPEIVIQKERRQATGYVEQLSETVSLEMVAIPAGTFTMGSPEDEPERFENESPQHEVTVPAFFMGKYSVTQTQWSFVAGLPQVERQLEADPAEFKGADHPVERVLWLDAVEFCARLSRLTGKQYRLPTEAEWEYACRAGTTTPFHFGGTILPDLANYGWNYAYDDSKVTKKKDFRGTTPVGQFGVANAFGLYDMHGNVWEWCADQYYSSYEGAPTDGSAWIDETLAEQASYVLRGGSWSDNPRSCRSAVRYGDDADWRYSNDGFRVVCSASRTS